MVPDIDNDSDDDVSARALVTDVSLVVEAALVSDTSVVNDGVVDKGVVSSSPFVERRVVLCIGVVEVSVVVGMASVGRITV